ncbi:DUF4174 domain-containing protein [Dyadobacter sediminis]|uniref:DUF4174 domain-containing protein n=1 Tax=Dyadobacter sediminis TaxID=1493691 RepID=A0A5R9KJM5_9BACT|nr:DUF4174 domain-containing protein [Dyadobacter sediminis]TLU96428.1 DUF4174 domain-containing protein [Dyadobacter sediminis]GGB82146.1 hypothetical protein GCM10011325_07080 [Dyadobacter sediminis]
MKTITALMLMILTMADQPRKVLLFYKPAGEQQWKAQLQELEAAQKEIRERDIEIRSISGSARNADEWKKWNVDTSEAFTFILIGRDGGEKLRSAEIVKTDKLFGLIDAMPMRRREMKKEP